MPKGIGRPYNKREKQAVKTIKETRQAGLDVFTPGRPLQAQHTLHNKQIKDDARRLQAPGLRALAGRTKMWSPGSVRPPKGFK